MYTYITPSLQYMTVFFSHSLIDSDVISLIVKEHPIHIRPMTHCNLYVYVSMADYLISLHELFKNGNHACMLLLTQYF